MRSRSAAGLALSFAAVAEEYQRGRPTYPKALVTWVLGTEPLRVLDVGAGTGKLTEIVAAAGHDVTAAEPLSEMRVVLKRRLASVRAVAASAEQLPLPPESYHAIVVGQAFHWFDHDRALTEMARVARPNAVLGLFWNVYAGRERWLRYPRTVPARPLSVVRKHPSWGDAEHRSHAWNYRVTNESLLAFIRSHSSVASMSAAERDAYTSRVSSAAERIAREKTLPIVTHVWRLRLSA
jgi:ubiquinone/menaquinone biosynthesis C-methylase UbiE